MTRDAVERKVATFGHISELESRALQIEAVIGQVKRLFLSSPNELPLPQVIQGLDELRWQFQQSAQQMEKLTDAIGIQRRQLNAAPPSQTPMVDGLRGSTRTLRIPDLLGVLSSQRKTGTLTITAGDENFAIELLHGAVVHLVSNRPRPEQRLGTILVARNRISTERLDAFLTKHSPEDGPIGQAMARESLISEEDLRDALQVQVRELFRQIFELDEAQFRFVDGKVTDLEMRVCMNTVQLMLDAARRKDETAKV